MAQHFDENSDVIDSRDVIERLEELRDALDDPDSYEDLAALDADRAELADLEELESQADSAADWIHGETLVRDSYFEEYAQQLAEDCAGSHEEADIIAGRNSGAHWPFTAMSIDWEEAASQLQVDYFSVEFRGVTYWIR